MKNTPFVSQNTLFGGFIGLSFILASYVFFKTGQSVSLNPQLNNVLMLLSIAGAFIGTRKFREEQLGGPLRYAQALGICVYLIATASVLYGCYIYILYRTYPELLENYLEMTADMLEEVYKDSPLLENMQVILKSFMNAGVIAISEVFNKIFTGFIFSLFLAGILRRK